MLSKIKIADMVDIEFVKLNTVKFIYKARSVEVQRFISGWSMAITCRVDGMEVMRNAEPTDQDKEWWQAVEMECYRRNATSQDAARKKAYDAVFGGGK